MAGVTLAAEAHDSDNAETRREAVGALLRYATGFSVGALCGLLRAGPLERVPRPIAAVGIAAATTANTVAPYSALGVSDPRTWPAKSWAAGNIPHLCYWWATGAAFDGLHKQNIKRRTGSR